MTPHRLAATLAFGLSSAVIVLACSSSTAKPGAAGDSTNLPPTATGSSGTSGSTSGEGGVGDAAGDAAADDAGPLPTCAPITRQGTAIAEVLTNTAAPAPVGGKIVPGTYDLSEYDAYDPAAGTSSVTGRTAQSTIVVTASSIEMSSSRVATVGGMAVETIAAWTYTIEQSTLIRTSVCPTTGMLPTIQYSAVGGALVLYPDTTHRELYQKR